MEHPELIDAVGEVWAKLDTDPDPATLVADGEGPAVPQTKAPSLEQPRRKAGGGHVLLEEAYVHFHTQVTRALVPEVDEAHLDELARNDWRNDTKRLGRVLASAAHKAATITGLLKGRGKKARGRAMMCSEVVCLDEEGFRRSVLEMADLWTDSIDKDEYLHFIHVVRLSACVLGARCGHAVTTRISTRSEPHSPWT